MKIDRNISDNRQSSFCAYCGSYTETKDHVPSKILLDKPYPNDLPKVSCCYLCNNKISLDEEYTACYIECARLGTINDSEIERNKIRNSLSHNNSLRLRLKKAMQHNKNGLLYFTPEEIRIQNVILKLAKGHATYELNEPQLTDPLNLKIIALSSMTSYERQFFETPPTLSILPEVGSRAMQRIVYYCAKTSIWINIQPKRYRYLTHVDDKIVIRLVLSEYLAAEVIWN
jgi:hypothetical protein